MYFYKRIKKSEYDNMKEKEVFKYQLFSSILISLGPILWLFTNIYDKNYKVLPVNIALAIIGVAVIFFNFKLYLKNYNKSNSTIIEILRHIISFLLYIVMLIIIIIIFVSFFIAITFIQEKIFIRGDYLTYLTKSPYSYLIFVVEALIMYLFFTCNKKNGHIWIDKFILPSVIILTYIIITSVTVVTENGIYDYSFYNLKGNKYEFSDVEYVDTGFIYKGRNKGEFFYNIKLNDGKKIKLAHPSLTQPGKQYDNDTWQEYVDIDKLIMNSNVKKTSSEKGCEYIDMDNIYVDKLLKVIRNK